VSPRSQHPGPGLVEHHHERIRIRINLKAVIGTPVRRGHVLPDAEVLEDPAKAVLLGIEYPSAVTGVDGDVIHADIVPYGSDRRSAVCPMDTGDSIRHLTNEPRVVVF
jgi:hypothetical protein